MPKGHPVSRRPGYVSTKDMASLLETTEHNLKKWVREYTALEGMPPCPRFYFGHWWWSLKKTPQWIALGHKLRLERKKNDS